MSLIHLGVDLHRTDLPIDLADHIQQDDEEPCSRHPSGNIYRGSLRTTHGAVMKVCVLYSLVTSPPRKHQRVLSGCNYNHHDGANK